MKKPKTTRKNYRLPKPLAAAIKTKAKRSRITETRLVTGILSAVIMEGKKIH